jgi:TolA-binding protein
VSVNYGDKEWTAKAFLEIGRILEAKGDTEKAIEQFRKTVEKYPDHNVAVVAKQRLDALRRQ